MKNFGSPYEKNDYRLTALRLVKKQQCFVGVPEFTFDADFYCVQVEDASYTYETENEIVVYVKHFILKDACLVTCSFSTGNQFELAAVILEGRSLYFQDVDGLVSFNFEISGLTGATRTLGIHTIVREPGITLRVEQNNSGRRAGKYRSVVYPELQILAANHYMFAMREILRMMDMGRYVNEKKAGLLAGAWF